jgi:hypothetical protein
MNKSVIIIECRWPCFKMMKYHLNDKNVRFPEPMNISTNQKRAILTDSLLPNLPEFFIDRNHQILHKQHHFSPVTIPITAYFLRL